MLSSSLTQLQKNIFFFHALEWKLSLERNNCIHLDFLLSLKPEENLPQKWAALHPLPISLQIIFFKHVYGYRKAQLFVYEGLFSSLIMGHDAVVLLPSGSIWRTSFSFFVRLSANFHAEYSVYPSRTLTRILHYCPGLFGLTVFPLPILWHPNGPATPLLLSEAVTVCF